MTMPLWISEAQALGTPSIAVVGLVIAWFTWSVSQQQARTARQKLRLDLYPLRCKIYDDAHKAILAALNDATGILHDESTIAFHASLRQSRYLLDAETFDYLCEVDVKVLRHRVRNKFLLDPLSNLGARHQAFLDDFLRNQQWLLDNVRELDERVKPFLQIDDGLSFSLRKVPDLGPILDDATGAFTNAMFPPATGLIGSSQRLAKRIRRVVQRPFV